MGKAGDLLKSLALGRTVVVVFSAVTSRGWFCTKVDGGNVTPLFAVFVSLDGKAARHYPLTTPVLGARSIDRQNQNRNLISKYIGCMSR